MPTDHPVAPLLARLCDEVAVLPPRRAQLGEVLAGYAHRRQEWYADLLGPLLLPASVLPSLPAGPLPRLGVVGDTGLAGIAPAFAAIAGWGECAQFEVSVAKRGEDPLPGLRTLLTAVAGAPVGAVFAELPLTWGLRDALDLIAAERVAGVPVAPKFRTGGLAAELFPTPVELAAVICACRDRGLPFKLTAGLHHALRHTDPETGLTHHGFLNVLAGCLVAAGGAEVADVAELLGGMDPVPVVETVRARLDHGRPLWTSFGSCRIDDSLNDLLTLGLLGPPPPGSGQPRRSLAPGSPEWE